MIVVVLVKRFKLLLVAHRVEDGFLFWCELSSHSFEPISEISIEQTDLILSEPRLSEEFDSSLFVLSILKEKLESTLHFFLLEQMLDRLFVLLLLLFEEVFVDLHHTVVCLASEYILDRRDNSLVVIVPDT